jgi:hypothetical protein
MTKTFRVVLELLLPDEEKYRDVESVRKWVSAWVRDDLIYEADAEFDGRVVEVSESSTPFKRD